MYQAKICHLGLSLLIRLNPSDEYWSFLGGGTQRPHRNNQGRALPAQDHFKPSESNSIHKNSETLILEEKINFCPLHNPSPSLFQSSSRCMRAKGLNKAGIGRN